MSLAIKAIQLEVQARKWETKQEWAAALSVDQQAINMLMDAHRECKDKTTKQLITTKLHQWFDAAEVLKKTIASHNKEVSTSTKNETSNDSPTSVKARAPPNHKRRRYQWSDVVGLERAKNSIQNSMVIPRIYPQLYHNVQLNNLSCLLYGPPGTGKSFLARVTADELACKFYSVTTSDIMSKWVGESEQQIRQVFTTARNNVPSVLFFDEIDALSTTRSDNMADGSRRMISQLLVEMDGIDSDNTGLLILGATNHPWDIDAAVLRRFTDRVLVYLPLENDRATMLTQQLPPGEHTLDTKQVGDLAKQTQGMSGADLRSLVNNILLHRGQVLHQAHYFYQDEKWWRPCDQDHPHAQRLGAGDLPIDRLQFGFLTFDMFKQALAKHKRVPNPHATRYRDWSQGI
jgi:vacuolar protein-sorting-associated protein 4